MSVDKEFLKNKIKEFSYAFKLSATLAILAIKKNDLQTVKFIHKKLKNIEVKLSAILKKLYGAEIVNAAENEEFEKLPQDMQYLTMINTYKKFLSCEYLNIKSNNTDDKILFNKMCLEFNPFDEIPLFSIGEILLENKKYKELLALISYIKEFSDSAPVYNLAGDTYRALKRYGEAADNYLCYLNKNKKDPDVIKKLNETYEEALS